MSSERIYLLEGRPYEVSRALRFVLSQNLQAGLSMGEQSLWVRVPPEKTGPLQEVLWAYGSLCMGESRDGAPYRGWAREQMEQKKNGQEGSAQKDQGTLSTVQRHTARVVRLGSPEGSFVQPDRGIQIDTASPVFHWPMFVEGAQELIPRRGPGRKPAEPSAQAEEQASVV